MTACDLEAGTFTSGGWLSAECAAHYHEHGWVLLQQFLNMEHDVLPIHAYVNHLIDLKLAQVGLQSIEPQVKRLIRSKDYLAICRTNRELGGEIYRASRHLCALHQLTAKPELLQLARLLMGTAFVNLIPYTAMRVDTKGEEQYLFPWHQDYPYTQGSMDGIVVWVPLFDLNEGDGGVQLIPGSHKQGLQRVELVDPGNTRKNGAHTIRIENAERFDSAPSVIPSVKAGDVVVFNTLLIHRSVPMTRDGVRWTTQIRYANFSNPDAVRRGWPGGMIEGINFERDHPEYVVSVKG